MLGAAAALAGSICWNAGFDPGTSICISSDSIIADKKTRRETVLRRRTSKDTREHLFGVDSVVSSEVDKTSLRSTLRISDVVEVRDARNFDGRHESSLPSRSRTLLSPGQGKKWRASASFFTSKEKLSLASLSAACTSSQENLSVGAALENNFKESRARRNIRCCCFSPIFRMRWK